jgi:chemotaxis protein CheD
MAMDLKIEVPVPTETGYDAQRYYLHPGHLFVSRAPVEVTTVVGSCVAVCLWDRGIKAGGINHYVLPGSVGMAATLRHGETAMNELIERLIKLGAGSRTLRARVFGGSCVIDAFRASGNDLGSKNVLVARRLLSAHRIPIIQEDVGGSSGRKIVFSTADGEAIVRSL